MKRFRDLLQFWSEDEWVVTINNSEEGNPPIAEQWRQEKQFVLDKISGHKMVKAVIESFPGATIQEIRPLPATVDRNNHEKP